MRKRVGPTLGCVTGSANTWLDRMTLVGKVAEAGHPPARTNFDLRCGCKFREMTGMLQVKCAIAGCHLRQRVTLALREELRRT